MEIISICISIIGVLVAVGIACWTSRNSAKDTAKQIAALEDSTNKQIESIKSLSRQMIESSINQVELEIEKNLFLAKQAQQEWKGISEINNSEMAHLLEWKNISMQRFHEQKPERDYKLYSKFIKDLESIKKGLVDSKKKLIA